MERVMGIPEQAPEDPGRSTSAGTGADVLRLPARVAARELLLGGTVHRHPR
jgi:hypothetical protein